MSPFPPRMTKRVIIFDMDGVLFDSFRLARGNFLDVYPSVTDEMYREIFCGNFYDEVKKYLPVRIIETDEEKRIRQKKYTERKSKAKLFDGIKDLLEELYAQGFTLVLGTGAHDRNSSELIKASGIGSLFDFIASAELTKNKAEKFKIIEAKYNCKKEDILFITDTLGDVKEADIAGIPTVAVLWGFHDRSFFAREKHSNLLNIASTVKELKNFIMDYFKVRA